MKKKKSKGLLFLIFAVILFVPVAFAAIFLRSNLDADLHKGTVDSIFLTHGEEEKEVTNKEEIAFFVDAATGGTPLAAAANELSSYRNLQVEFHKYNASFVYQFYLSDSENDCVYTDPEGNLFLFPPEVAKELQGHSLLKEYGLSFAEYPSLTLHQGGEDYPITCLTGEWNFVRADGEKEKQRLDKEKEVSAKLPQGEKLDFQFSIQPDYCNVLLSVKDGELVYSGLYDEMPAIHLEEDTNLTMVVSCDWYEKEGVSYYGSLTYTVELFYDIPTLCTLDRNEVLPGESIQLTVTHSSSEKIAVNPDFASGKIEIIKEGSTFTATIPVAETVTPGEYGIMIMGSDVEQTVNITVLSQS